MSFASSRRGSYDIYYEKIYNELDEDNYTPSPAVSSTINSFSRSPSSAAQTIVEEVNERAKNTDSDSDFSDDDQPFHDIDFDEHIGINFYDSLPSFNDAYADSFAAGSFFQDMPDSPTEGLYINPSFVQPDHNDLPLPQSPAPAPVFALDTFKSADNVLVPLLPTSEATVTSSPIAETLSPITEDRPIVPLRAGGRAARARRHSVIIAPSDNEDSDNEPDDDDYCPSPPLNPKKRRRSSQPAAPAAKKAKVATTMPPASASEASTSSSTKPKVARKQRLPPAPRNVQVVGIDLLDLLETMDWQCQACKWEQDNHRKPDFIRHLLTHQQPDRNDQSRGFWCKGLRLVDREVYNKLAIRVGREPIPEDAEDIVYLFEKRVGGCMRTFSRRDALKRHIDNTNNNCCGHALEPFQEFDCKCFILSEVWGRY
ncbi:hypothetical protein IW261DRAFT_1415099 [Armillaria novae-zelandiae]|uniref:Uncharacterized protein n=1 Tax=Armillaria novae-zelandiae TaxID=153914 RepID=A0AA39PP33_9AGAR|nr:hypothetical protein IW261DRAFT_1415099 [Armillaria novae-zelandiae]